MLYFFIILEHNINALEQFKDFFADLKERASSPLISSFIISWLLINWPITVGLVLYKQQDLKADGFNSYYELIKGYSNWTYTALIPFLFACAYTFAFPYVKAWIKLLNAKIEANNETEILSATSAGSMPVQKYVELRKSNEVLTSELKELIVSQSDFQKDREEFITQIAELNTMTNKLTSTLEEERIKQDRLLTNYLYHDSQFNGMWEVDIKVNNRHIKEKWYIIDSKVTVVGNERKTYTIINVLINRSHKNISLFIVEDVDDFIGEKNNFSLWFKFDNEFVNLTNPWIDNIKMSKLRS